MAELPYSQRMAEMAGQQIQQDQGDIYKMQMSRLGEQFQLEQARQVAHIGAQEMEQYGPEGQRWAQHLRSDPYAAVKMAELQGGFGAIIQRLKYAHAMGQATSAEDQMRAIGSAYGAPEQIDYMNALAAMNDSGEAKVYGTSKGQRPFVVRNGRIEYLPGYNEAQGQAELDPRFFRPDAQGIIRDVRSGRPAFPGQSPLDQARWTDIRTDRMKQVTDLENIAKTTELLDIADPHDPAWQRAVITITNKMLDSSAVMQGESEATAEAIRSQAGRIQNRVQQLATNSSNPLSPTEVSDIINQAKQMADRLLANAPNVVNSWEQENWDMGADPRDPLTIYGTPKARMERIYGAQRTLQRNPPERAAKPISEEEHAAAVEALKAEGIPEDQISPGMVADLLEESAAPEAAPPTPAPPRTGPISLDEIRAIVRQQGR